MPTAETHGANDYNVEPVTSELPSVSPEEMMNLRNDVISLYNLAAYGDFGGLKARRDGQTAYISAQRLRGEKWAPFDIKIEAKVEGPFFQLTQRRMVEFGYAQRISMYQLRDTAEETKVAVFTQDVDQTIFGDQALGLIGRRVAFSVEHHQRVSEIVEDILQRQRQSQEVAPARQPIPSKVAGWLVGKVLAPRS